MSAPFDTLVAGRFSIDHVGPPGVTRPGFQPDAKINGWDVYDQELWQQIDSGVAERFSAHDGGGGPNMAAGLAYLGEKVGMLSIAGKSESDQQMLARLQERGIDTTYVKTDPEFQIAIGLVRRDAKGRRENRIGPFTSLEIGLDEEDIKVALSALKPDETGVRPESSRQNERKPHIAINSLKSVMTTWRIIENAPEGAFLSLTPGSTDTPQDVIEFAEAGVDFLAVNAAEMRAYFSGHHFRTENPRRLAELYSNSYGAVLCTLGRGGLILARNGSSEHRDIIEVDAVDDNGAGDAAAAHGALAARYDWSLEDSLEFIALGGARAVQEEGAQGYTCSD